MDLTAPCFIIEFFCSMLRFLGVFRQRSTQITKSQFPKCDENVKLIGFLKTIFLPTY